MRLANKLTTKSFLVFLFWMLIVLHNNPSSLDR